MFKPNKAKEIINKTLKECCRDLIDWNKYGVLSPNSYIRLVAETLCNDNQDYDEDWLGLAKQMVMDEAVKFVVDSIKPIKKPS